MSLPTPAAVPSLIRAHATAGNLNGTALKLLDTWANWTAMLPNQNLADLLAGALLTLRRNLFDQAPSASPVQETTSSAGQILGTLGAVDPENDPLAYSVVTNPQFGTVVVTDDGHYTYTPGADYAGADSFTVRVADTNGGHNVFTPRAQRATEVTVAVGAEASTNPFCAGNLSDASLLLKNTGARINVEYQNRTLSGSVTLTIPDDARLLWLDEHGRTGTITAADVASHWDGIQNAGQVMLGIDYALDDGSEATLILRNVTGSYIGSNQYVFSGLLAPDARDGAGVNSFWDVIGNEYKACYENFREQNGIDDSDFRSLTLNVGGANVYLDTFSVHDYEQELVGTDPGTPVSAFNPSPGEASDRFQKLAASATTVTDGVSATAFLNYGSGGTSLIVGNSDGSVEQWDGQSFTQLHVPGPWGGPYSTPPNPSPVKSIISYQTGIVLGLANGSVQQWDGTTWTELRSYSETPDSQVLAAMVPYQSGFVIGMTGASSGVLQWTGTEWKKLAGYGTTADWTGSISAMVAYPKTSSFVVGLDSGALRQWTGTEWQDIMSESEAAQRGNGGVTALLADQTSVVVARSNGVVEQWTGEQQWDSSYWRQVAGPGSPVTFMKKLFSTETVVGRADGSVQKLTSDVYSRLSEQKLLTAGGGYFGPPGGSLDDYSRNFYAANVFGDRVGAGQKLSLGDSLTSANGAYTLALQQDGNLALYGGDRRGTGQAIWASGTYGKSVDRGELTADGNLVLYSGTKVVWQTKTAGNSNVALVVQDDRNVVLYSGSTAIWASKTNTSSTAPTVSAVTSGIEYNGGFVLGWADGSLKEFRFAGATNAGGQYQWIDLGSNSAAVSAMAPYSKPPHNSDDNGWDGFYVALNDGVIKRYERWPNKWFDLKALPAKGSFSQATLENAVNFAQKTTSVITSADDPLFGTNGLTSYQPLCMSDNSCGSGSIYTFNISKAPASLAGKNLQFAGAGQSVDLSYDLGTTGYGYVYVPGGIWKKLDPDQYSFGAMLALTTGPRLTLNLGEGCADNTCTLTAAETKLASLSWTSAPSPYGNITLSGDVSAKLDVTLGVPDGFTKKKLNATAYLTGGVVLAYNTPEGYWNGGWNYYYKTDVSDFTSLTSVSLIPTLTPTITGTWGYTVPNIPVLGTVSLASVGLTYSNPVDLTLTFAKDISPSLTLGSSGTLEFKAGFVPDLTSKLSYTKSFPLYSVRTGNLLTA